MATRTIVYGNIYVTNGSVSGDTITYNDTDQKCIEITSTKIDQNYDNQVSELPIPISRDTRDTYIASDNEPYARIIDLKRIKEAITVQGALADEATESANTKKDDLLLLGKLGGALTILWNLDNYQTIWKPETDPLDGNGVFIVKMLFTETAGIIGDNVTGDSQPLRKIDFQGTFVRGKDM